MSLSLAGGDAGLATTRSIGGIDLLADHGIEGVGEVDAEDLLAMLDAENVHDVGRDEVGFSCFYSAGHARGDQNPSAHINRDSLLWRCSGCGRAGNLLELVKIGLPDQPVHHVAALRWLRENFGEATRKPVGGSLTADLLARLEAARYVPPVRRLPNEAATIGPEGIFAIDWRSDHEAAAYMRGRGFAPGVLEDWGLGYDAWTRRVVIPYRDEDGTLVGFKGRALGDEAKAKYLLLGDTEERQPRYGIGYGFEMMDDSKVVFGLDRAVKMIDSAGVPVELRPNKPGQPDVRDVRPGKQASARRRFRRAAMPEGELDVIAAHAAGVPAVAPGTTSITNDQLWLLRAHFDELVFFYDAGAGDDAVWGREDPGSGKRYPGLVEKISPYFRLYVVDAHEGDPASMEPQQIRDLFAGAQHWLRYAVPSAGSV